MNVNHLTKMSWHDRVAVVNNNIYIRLVIYGLAFSFGFIFQRISGL